MSREHRSLSDYPVHFRMPSAEAPMPTGGKDVTAHQLHRLFASTDDPERYEAGHGPWRVDSRFGEVHFTVCEASGETCFTAVLRLGDEGLDDLELALRGARSARDAYRANELQRNRRIG